MPVIVNYYTDTGISPAEVKQAIDEVNRPFRDTIQWW